MPDEPEKTTVWMLADEPYELTRDPQVCDKWLAEGRTVYVLSVSATLVPL
jgi:hypothetical protein